MSDQKRCATCGGELTEGRCAACADKAASKIVRLDAARLLTLAIVSLGCFMGTRAVAKMDRENDRRQAAAFYAKGMNELKSGDEKNAIEDLREATVHDRYEPRYSLALAQALSNEGQDDEALQLLL